MGDGKKVSVIIPMYNSEPFIRQSIQSVLDQTWRNLEVLVVDDGSVDWGPEICMELKKRDDRICLYRKSRGGVSAARNCGLAHASGEYLFFLDSDDAIHPLLIEKMVCQMEKHRADLAFCDYEKLDSRQLEEKSTKISSGEEKSKWRVEEGKALEERFHGEGFEMLSGIGGKMMRKDLLKDLRFDEGLPNGEDTWFLYQLISRQIRSVFSFRKWYFYRMHPESVTHSSDVIRGKRYFESARRIRDCEYQKRQLNFALRWELYIVARLEKQYAAMKRMRDVEGCRGLEEQAAVEKGHPLYSCIPLRDRMLFFNCFHCYFLFRIQGRCRQIASSWKKADFIGETAEEGMYDRDVSVSDRESGTGRPQAVEDIGGTPSGKPGN